MPVSTVPYAGLTSPLGGSVITSGTAVTSTSGSSITFTSIPSWVKRVTMLLSGVSTNGSSVLQVQIGSGSLVTSGYLGSVNLIINASSTFTAAMATGHYVTQSADPSSVIHGKITIELLGSNKYVITGMIGFSNGAATSSSASSVSTTGAIDRVSISPFIGTESFDAGTINILYE